LYSALTWSCFPGDTASKTFDGDDGAFMDATRDDFERVPRFDLERDLSSLDVDDADGAGDILAKRSRCRVAQVEFDSDRAFVWFQKGLQRFASSSFQQSDEVGRAQNRRHAVRREVDDMLLLDEETKLTHGADFRTGLHARKYFLKVIIVCAAACSELGYGSASAEA